MWFNRLFIVFVASAVTASCDRKPDTARANDSPKEHAQSSEKETEDERQPREDEIAEHCVAFVRATKVVPARSPSDDCPDCAATAEAGELLTFQEFRVDRISCSDDTCTAIVTIRATFNPTPPGPVAGGLTAWLSPEQRNGYLTGHPPTGEQAFPVKVIYKRNAKGWRPVEFDKADSP